MVKLIIYILLTIGKNLYAVNLQCKFIWTINNQFVGSKNIFIFSNSLNNKKIHVLCKKAVIKKRLRDSINKLSAGLIQN